MYRLKSREKYIPGGFKFVQPETGWASPNNASFEVIVQALIAHRLANPFLLEKHKWPTQVDAVRDELDAYNAHICAVMGWGAYVAIPIGEPPPPKSQPLSQSQQSQLSAAGAKAKKIWSGVRTLNDWLDSNEPPVAKELSASRATVCAACPKNGQGGFEAWFTMPASEAIRRQVAKAADRNLTTPSDDKLNVCVLCLCPLKLKVHTPLKFIKETMSAATLNELKTAPACWIVAELEA